MMWILMSNKDLSISHRKKCYGPSYMRLMTSLMYFECHPCGIFESLAHPQVVEIIAPATFASCAGLGYRIKKLVSSNFMGMMRVVLIIFDTGVTYLCSSNNGYVVNLEAKTPPRKLKDIAKDLIFMYLELSSILSVVKVEVLLRSGIRHIMFLGYQNICTLLYHKASEHQKYKKVTLYLTIMMSMIAMQSST